MKINEIENLLGLRQVEDFNDKPNFEGVLISGEFNLTLFDYNTGMLYVNIGNRNPNAKMIMTISTIDDGVWQAFYSGDVNSFDFKLFATKFTESYGNVLPTENQLNAFLETFNAYGLYTG